MFCAKARDSRAAEAATVGMHRAGRVRGEATVQRGERGEEVGPHRARREVAVGRDEEDGDVAAEGKKAGEVEEAGR